MGHRRYSFRTTWCFFGILSCLLSSYFSQGLASDIPDFEPTQYPTKNFKTTRKTYTFGSAKIYLEQVKPKDESQEHFYCRAWVTVKKGNQTVIQKYWDIEPLGGHYGLGVPAQQPLKEYFIFAKSGDYEGRLFFVKSDGKVVDVEDGRHKITQDARYLIENWEADETESGTAGHSVYDLETGNVVYSLTKEALANARSFNPIEAHSDCE